MEKKEFITRIMNTLFEAAAEDAIKEDGISQERIDVSKEKMHIAIEQKCLEVELDSYTHNTYIGIAKILNEHHRKVNELLSETCKKCKAFLDDNNLPYEEEREEKEEEDVQSK